MGKAYRNRLGLLVAFLVLTLMAFFVLATPILSDGENYRHSIADHLLGNHAAIVDFDFDIALSNTLLMILPLSFTFLMFDLYGLRETPVQHLGIFACCLIAAVVNTIVSLGIWMVLGGWSSPAVGPVMAVIFAASLILGTISEWRIFTAAGNVGEIAA